MAVLLLELADQGQRERRVLGRGAGCRGRPLHRLERTRQVTVQLADVRQPGEAREIRRPGDQAIDRIGRLVVPTQLDQGIDDDGGRAR